MDALRKRADEDSGFTLIELLVVVIIIGILAAIAIPVFLNQRERAWQGEVTSDVRNFALEVEAVATQNGGAYPDDVSDLFADLNTDSLNYGDNVTLWYEKGSAIVRGEHSELEGDFVCYDSAAGGIQDFNTEPEADRCDIGESVNEVWADGEVKD